MSGIRGRIGSIIMKKQSGVGFRIVEICLIQMSYKNRRRDVTREIFPTIHIPNKNSYFSRTPIQSFYIKKRSLASRSLAFIFHVANTLNQFGKAVESYYHEIDPDPYQRKI